MKDLPIKVDTTHSAQFLALNSDSGAGPTSNYGKDIIDGLADTGVWLESASFNNDELMAVPLKWKGECEVGTQFNMLMCNKKIIGARSFNKALVAKNPNITFSMNSTVTLRDRTRTHPPRLLETTSRERLSLAMLQELPQPWLHGPEWPCTRPCGTNSHILQILSPQLIRQLLMVSMSCPLSCGSNSVPLYEDAIAIATYADMEKVIFVSRPTGNAGPFLKTLHNGTPWVITVAAGDMDSDFAGNITLGSGVSIAGSTLFPGDPSLGESPIVFADACNNTIELNKISHTNIVVCKDKSAILSDQIDKVRGAKVASGVFITNSSVLEFFIQSSFPAIFFESYRW
ncbi:hypothetical protein NL676_024930 [Syzygium grande]|nr:hypothetical protein NL676_024930 [Syzygium grande]